MKENRKILILSAIIALVVSGLTIGFIYPLVNKGKTIKIEHLDSTPASRAMFTLNNDGEVVPLDFTEVAANVKNAVVHIRSTFSGRVREDMPDYQELPDPFRDFFDDFFGPRMRQERAPRQGGQPPVRMGQGSGVIISKDGYIVTNNHVIADADDIEVTLADNTSYKATVIGTDPTTDLALVKIEGNDLTTIPFYNSDDVKVGEWVLAVGNPFNLTSTVTAGIISAKGRAINILQEQFAIESFIQTDAAINPGNSGGALVNLQGGLIGINTAIASPTGAYSGYGFAVPSDIVQKVVEDLMKYGTVQRGVLGVMIRTVDGNFAKQQNLKVNNGVYVDSLLAGSAAGAAGMKPGDVIVSIEGKDINTSPQLQEQIARKRPGDKVQIKVNRNGNEKTFDVILKSRSGSTDIVTKETIDLFRDLGADFETLSKEKAKQLGIDGGVQVKKLYPGKIRKTTQMREGFIITKVDGQKVTSVEKLANILESKQGGVMLEGIYENDTSPHYYAFGM